MIAALNIVHIIHIHVHKEFVRLPRWDKYPNCSNSLQHTLTRFICRHQTLEQDVGQKEDLKHLLPAAAESTNSVSASRRFFSLYDTCTHSFLCTSTSSSFCRLHLLSRCMLIETQLACRYYTIATQYYIV